MDLPDATTRENIATAGYATVDRVSDDVIGSADAQGSATIDFSDADVTEVDEEALVEDSYAGVLGTTSAATQYTYARTVQYDACGAYLVENTATATTNDLGIISSDSADVTVSVPCTVCTLTQGYWKTHSDEGPAPYDENWQNLGDADADAIEEEEQEGFFLSGQTYLDMFWTAVQGNQYYNLAHQYAAAQLNALNGASLADAQSTFDAATHFLQTTTPQEADVMKGKDRKAMVDMAGVLASFNEGLIGPGHCDENSVN